MENKILFVTSEYKTSGPNNVVKSLLHGLGYRVNYNYITSIRRKECQKFKSELLLNKENIFSQKGASSLLHLIKVIKQVNPSIINTHGFRADLLVFLLSFFGEFKQVSTIHNLPNEDYTMRYGKYIGRLYAFVHSIVFRSSRVKKVCVSKHTKANLINKFNAKNVTFLYNGVIADDYTINSLNNNSIMESFQGEIKFVFCGHLTDIKDPIIIVELAKSFPKYDFIFLGDGPLRSRLELCKPKNVFFAGRVNNVSEYLSIADYYIMPSKTEGMPMALIEAMLMNLPLITSDIPIFKELSEIEGISINCFKVGNIDDLVKVVSNLKTPSEIKNRTVALNNFSSKVMAKKYLGEFCE